MNDFEGHHAGFGPLPVPPRAPETRLAGFTIVVTIGAIAVITLLIVALSAASEPGSGCFPMWC